MSSSLPFRKKPLFTIIIPTYNRGYCVGRAIESALIQSYPNLEIIVSNNNSSDNTREVLNQFSDSRLSVYHREETISAEAHGNWLFNLVKGEFLLGLSDDDYLELGFVERVMEMFENHSSLAFVYTRTFIHYRDVIVPSRNAPEIETGSAFVEAYLNGEREICWCSCVTRTKQLVEIGNIPDGIIFGDMYIWTKLVSKGDIGFVNACLSHYTFMGDNLSSGVPVLVWSKYTRMFIDDLVSFLCIHTKPDGQKIRNIVYSSDQYVARSTANQIMWCSIRGFSKLKLLKDLSKAFHFLHGDYRVWIRAILGILLPSSLQILLVLAAAKKRQNNILK